MLRCPAGHYCLPLPHLPASPVSPAPPQSAEFPTSAGFPSLSLHVTPFVLSALHIPPNSEPLCRGLSDCPSAPIPSEPRPGPCFGLHCPLPSAARQAQGGRRKTGRCGAYQGPVATQGPCNVLESSLHEATVAQPRSAGRQWGRPQTPLLSPCSCVPCHRQGHLPMQQWGARLRGQGQARCLLGGLEHCARSHVKARVHVAGRGPPGPGPGPAVSPHQAGESRVGGMPHLSAWGPSVTPSPPVPVPRSRVAVPGRGDGRTAPVAWKPTRMLSRRARAEGCGRPCSGGQAGACPRGLLGPHEGEPGSWWTQGH